MAGGIGDSQSEHFPCVELEAVVQAHLKALETPAAANKRFLLINCSLYFNEMAARLHAEFATNGFPNIKDGVTLKEGDVKGPNKQWRRSQSEEILGIKYAPDFMDEVIAQTHHMIEVGYLKKA